jgi:hypothetical protein
MKTMRWIFVAAPAVVSSFTTWTSSRSPVFWNIPTKRARPLCASASVDSNKHDKKKTNEDDGLVFDGLDQEMGKMASKFSFPSLDYLAEAKKRAEARVESKNASAGDDDWQTLAEDRKSKFGEMDDWENSVKEAGNQDSQILMFTEPPTDGDDEPKLLLF